MTDTKKSYKNPSTGQPLISTISSGCKTPILEIKFCNLVKPFYYPNSPKIPRYSITCVIDPVLHKEFLEGIRSIEENEKVDSIIKKDTSKEGDEQLTSGKLIIKFQTKDPVPVYEQKGNGKPELITLEDELAKGSKVMVVYEILRYTKKNPLKTEHGLSFKPTTIYFYPS